MKIGVKVAGLGAGWGGSGISVGFSWFGERSGGMLWVGEDVGDRGFVGELGDGNGMPDERNMNGTRARKRPKEL